MNGFSPFLKKEFFELYRKGRLLLFGILFVFFGILAPATAKLTPALFKMMSGELEQQGIIIKEISSTAASSYEQFFSNLSIILIVFVVVFASSITSEFSKGTAIPLLTKGLSRVSFFLSKLLSSLTIWSAGLWLCFGITYGYTAYYWKDDSVQSVIPAVLLWWLFSVMVICLMFFFASFLQTHIQVMICTGGSVSGCPAVCDSFFAMLKMVVPIIAAVRIIMPIRSRISGVDLCCCCAFGCFSGSPHSGQVSDSVSIFCDAFACSIEIINSVILVI